MYMYGGPLEIYNICTCIIGSLIEAHLFEGMEQNEECDCDHTLIDVSSVEGSDKENCNVWQENSNMCKDNVIENDV